MGVGGICGVARGGFGWGCCVGFDDGFTAAAALAAARLRDRAIGRTTLWSLTVKRSQVQRLGWFSLQGRRDAQYREQALHARLPSGSLRHIGVDVAEQLLHMGGVEDAAA